MTIAFSKPLEKRLVAALHRLGNICEILSDKALSTIERNEETIRRLENMISNLESAVNTHRQSGALMTDLRCPKCNRVMIAGQDGFDDEDEVTSKPCPIVKKCLKCGVKVYRCINDDRHLGKSYYYTDDKNSSKRVV